MKKIFLIIFSLALMAGCKPKIDEYSPNQGSADFSRFISVGNSMVAGYADGALYNSGQVSSIPNILSRQLRYAGADSLVQPMVASEYGVLPGKRQVGYTTSCTGVTSLGVVPDPGELTPLAPVGYACTNLGIPGAKSFHMLAPHYGDFSALPNANPYYCRFSTNPANAVINEFAPLNPSFFMLFLGDNDVLSYALAGGAADSITPLPLFTYAMTTVVESLTANGAKGVVTLIPDVTSIPFFTTVPYNGLVLTQAQADQINYAMSQVYHLPFVYSAGPNPFLVADPTSPHPVFKVRQMQPGELVLLTVPQDSLKCAGMGIISQTTLTPYPIPNQFVLTLDEIAPIQAATVAFNGVLAGLANTKGLAICDMYENMKTLKAGIVWDGIKLNANFITGGAFSTDGVHLNPRGCSVAANYFIDAINAKYGSKVPYANVTAYPGLVFP